MSGDRGTVEALIVLDVISEFEHEDGDRLLASLRARADGIVSALEHARGHAIDVIYVNDAHGRWDGERSLHVQRALAAAGGEVMRRVAPEPCERFLFKGAYSAFDATPLRGLLAELGVTRIVLAGAAAEMCVAQTAITARERGLQVTVLSDACATVHPDNERIALEYLERVTGTFVVPVGRWRTRQPPRLAGTSSRPRSTTSGRSCGSCSGA